MTDEFQEGRHSIRSPAMPLQMSRLNRALNLCQLPKLNARCFCKNSLGFHCFFGWNSFLNLKFYVELYALMPYASAVSKPKFFTWSSIPFYDSAMASIPTFCSMLTCVSQNPNWHCRNMLVSFFCSQVFSETLNDTFICLENRDMNYEWIQPWHWH